MVQIFAFSQACFHLNRGQSTLQPVHLQVSWPQFFPSTARMTSDPIEAGKWPTMWITVAWVMQFGKSEPSPHITLGLFPASFALTFVGIKGCMASLWPWP